MQRAKRLSSLWAWLPTFRAVAERQHLSAAADDMGVSASAVSRMIRLLEEDVGQPLFDRVGRSIRLNPAGEQLLAGVRSAMRLVDESLALVAGAQMVGPVRIACAEPLLRSHLLPALTRLRARYPALVPDVEQAYDQDVGSLLLSGRLDVAFVAAPQTREQLSLRSLGLLPWGLYVGRGHPLHGRRRLALGELLEHRFVVVREERSWPPAQRRRIALTVDSCQLAMEICAEGELLAVLPQVFAEAADEGVVDELPFGGLRPMEVFAQWRQQLDLPGRAEAVIEAVEAGFVDERS